ncbi:unnamed protein product [Amoebophrya sp. A25]|nr:unnamed protein product [Amoebophrya sp. A25]|eukprot:GSA25T00004030001.1
MFPLRPKNSYVGGGTVLLFGQAGYLFEVGAQQMPYIPADDLMGNDKFMPKHYADEGGQDVAALSFLSQTFTTAAAGGPALTSAHENALAAWQKDADGMLLFSVDADPKAMLKSLDSLKNDFAPLYEVVKKQAEVADLGQGLPWIFRQDGSDTLKEDLRFSPQLPEVDRETGSYDKSLLWGSSPSFEAELFGSADLLAAHKAYKSQPNDIVTMADYFETAQQVTEKLKAAAKPGVPVPPKIVSLSQVMPAVENKRTTCTSTDMTEIAEKKAVDGRKQLFEEIYLTWAFGEAAAKADAALLSSLGQGGGQMLLQRLWSGFKAVLTRMAESLQATENEQACKQFRSDLVNAEQKLLGPNNGLEVFILDSDCEYLQKDAKDIPIWENPQGFEHIKAKSLLEALFFRFMMKSPVLCNNAKAPALDSMNGLKQTLGNLQPICVMPPIPEGQEGRELLTNKPDASKTLQAGWYIATGGPNNDAPKEGDSLKMNAENLLSGKPEYKAQIASAVKDKEPARTLVIHKWSNNGEDAPSLVSWNSVWIQRFRDLWEGKGDIINIRIIANVFYPGSLVLNFKGFNYLMYAMVMKGQDAAHLTGSKLVQESLRPLFSDENEPRVKHMQRQFKHYATWVEEGGLARNQAIRWHGLVSRLNMLVFQPAQRRGPPQAALKVQRFPLPLSPPLSKAERSASRALHPLFREYADGSKNVATVDFPGDFGLSVFGFRIFHPMHCYTIVWPLELQIVEDIKSGKPAVAKLVPGKNAELHSGFRMYFPKDCGGGSPEVLAELYSRAGREVQDGDAAALRGSARRHGKTAQAAFLKKCQPRAYVTPIRAIDESGFLRGNGPSGSSGDNQSMAYLFANAQTSEEFAIMRMYLVNHFASSQLHSFIEVLLGSEVDQFHGHKEFQMKTILNKLQDKETGTLLPVMKKLENLGDGDKNKVFYPSMAFLWEWFHNAAERTQMAANTATGTQVMEALGEKLPAEHKEVHNLLMELAREVAAGFVPDSLKPKEQTPQEPAKEPRGQELVAPVGGQDPAAGAGGAAAPATQPAEEKCCAGCCGGREQNKAGDR